MDPQVSNKSQLLFKLEQEIATLLLDKLEDATLTPERAAQIARFILQALPDNLIDKQVLAIIPSLDDEFFELSSVVNQHIIDYEKTKQKKVETLVHDLLQHQQFQKASQLMKLYFERKL